MWEKTKTRLRNLFKNLIYFSKVNLRQERHEARHHLIIDLDSLAKGAQPDHCISFDTTFGTPLSDAHPKSDHVEQIRQP